ncbi:MAG: class I SAM-dependent methyltransferase [Pelosinus sp.]|nr:class I SAM-dependent methyltransferase [Pelosinus sp.]
MNTKDYWNQRVKKYGHTGWADFATYYYDQNLRLKTLKDLIEEYSDEFLKALDYGCGTGEFSNLLAQYFDKVIAVDIAEDVIKNAIAANNNSRIHFQTYDEDIFNSQYGLIISITVLQHVTEDRQLSDLISKFLQSLAPNGKLIIFESFAKVNSDYGYIKLRRIEDVKSLLFDSGFKLIQECNFYHPTELPTRLYTKYRTNYFIKVLNKLCIYNIPFSKFVLKNLAKKFSYHDKGIVDDCESITRILIYGR